MSRPLSQRRLYFLKQLNRDNARRSCFTVYERGCTARLLVIKVRSHHAAPTPTIYWLTISWWIDFKWPFLFINVFTAWHRHISPMNFIIQQSRSFEGVCDPRRLTSCLFPVLDSQSMATELFQSLPFGSGTVFCNKSHPRRHFPSSALAWRHTSSNRIIHQTFVVPAKWHRHFAHINRFTYLLTSPAASLLYFSHLSCPGLCSPCLASPPHKNSDR